VSGQVELHIELVSERYDPLDERWARQVDAFAEELRQLPSVEVSRPRRPVPGTKGGLEGVAALVVTILSLRGLDAFERAWEAWLQRDQSRAIVATVQRGDRRERLEVRGHDLRDPVLSSQLRALLGDMRRRVDGAQEE
jgi:hypothetical protein